MSLLLAPVQVTLYDPPAGADKHGWATAPSAQVWQGNGNLQRMPGRADALASWAGGHGPFSPAHSDLATLYLPPDAPLHDGMMASVGGKNWALSQTRLVADPRGTGEMDCLTATATATDQFGAA